MRKTPRNNVIKSNGKIIASNENRHRGTGFTAIGATGNSMGSGLPLKKQQNQKFSLPHSSNKILNIQSNMDMKAQVNYDLTLDQYPPKEQLKQSYVQKTMMKLPQKPDVQNLLLEKRASVQHSLE